MRFASPHFVAGKSALPSLGKLTQTSAHVGNRRVNTNESVATYCDNEQNQVSYPYI